MGKGKNTRYLYVNNTEFADCMNDEHWVALEDVF